MVGQKCARILHFLQSPDITQIELTMIQNNELKTFNIGFGV